MEKTLFDTIDENTALKHLLLDIIYSQRLENEIGIVLPKNEQPEFIQRAMDAVEF